MPRRPNLAALLLSATLVLAGAAVVLRWQPAIPGGGMMQSGGGSPAGAVRPLAAPAAVGCREERRVIHGGYRFLPACYGHAPSFDRAYFIVKNPGRSRGVGLVRGGSGESLDDLGLLDDGHPFTLFWSPVNHRFFANHQQAGADRFRLFEVRGAQIASLPRLGPAAADVLRARRPCLGPDDVAVSGIRWARDGRRVALLVHGRQQACDGSGAWSRLWMIGDAVTGAIEADSIRRRPGRAPFPSDGPYATL